MSIKLDCAGCGAKLTVLDQHAGKRIECDNCHATVVVPTPGKPGNEATRAECKRNVNIFLGAVAVLCILVAYIVPPTHEKTVWWIFTETSYSYTFLIAVVNLIGVGGLAGLRLQREPR